MKVILKFHIIGHECFYNMKNNIESRRLLYISRRLTVILTDNSDLCISFSSREHSSAKKFQNFTNVNLWRWVLIFKKTQSQVSSWDIKIPRVEKSWSRIWGFLSWKLGSFIPGDWGYFEIPGIYIPGIGDFLEIEIFRGWDFFSCDGISHRKATSGPYGFKIQKLPRILIIYKLSLFLKPVLLK